jgi:hypothetical protein
MEDRFDKSVINKDEFEEERQILVDRIAKNHLRYGGSVIVDNVELLPVSVSIQDEDDAIQEESTQSDVTKNDVFEQDVKAMHEFI